MLMAFGMFSSNARGDEINFATTEAIARETNIAKEYAEQQRYPEALVHYKNALSQSIAVNGERHWDTARYMNEVGTAYLNMEQYAEAGTFLMQAAEIAEKAQDSSSLTVANIYRNLGFVLYRLGDHQKALDWHKKALAIRENAMGKESRESAESWGDIASVYNGIALVYSKRGDHENALKLHKQALKIEEEVFEEGDYLTAITYSNIGVAEGRLGNYKNALESLQKAVVIFEESEDKNNTHIGSAYTNMAWIYSRMRDFDKSEEWARKAMIHNERVFGKEHPTTGTSYGNIAMTYLNRKQYDKALSGYLQAYRICHASLGDASSQTRTLRVNLERAYKQTANPKPFDDWLAEAMARR
jgi:preprotein translocase subunit SecA/nephrocystin-3